MKSMRQVAFCVVLFLGMIAGYSSIAHAQSGGAAPEPFSEAKILTFLQSSVTHARLSELVLENGVDFTLTAEIEQQLRGAGADNGVINAIRAAKVRSAASLVINADSDCTVSVNGTSFDMRAGETRTVAAAVGDNIVGAVAKRD